MTLKVSNADRVVFPEVGVTKGDVVDYYERVAERVLPHVVGRPLSILRYPKGLAEKGFFQKNVPDHYPESIVRFEVPRSQAAAKKHPRGKDSGVTTYPLVSEASHLPYLANQGAIELHVTTARAAELFRPDRLVIDLDPPEGAVALVRRAALLTRDTLRAWGLETVPVATGSKGYHVVAAIRPTVDADELGVALQQLAALMQARHPDELTTAFRVASRGERVFVDWLRNRTGATVVAPYSLRARARASVAVPIGWDELGAVAPDGFAIGDVERLIDRPDPLAALAKSPNDARPFVQRVRADFETSGLEIEPFDRFRS